MRDRLSAATNPELVRLCIQRAKAGDRHALDALLQRARPQLERQAEAAIGPGMRCQLPTADLLQSAYARVLRSIRAFRGETEAELQAWLRRIVDRTLRDARRYVFAERRAKLRESSRPIDLMPGPGHTPSAEMSANEEVARIDAAIRRLPHDYAQILALHMDPEQTHARTARLMGRSAGACRVLLARARAALAAELQLMRDAP